MNSVTPKSPCPWCGKVCDRATTIARERAVPKPGDFAVCIECGSVNRYDAMLILVRATEAEWQRLPEPGPTIIRRARRAVLATHNQPA